MFVERLECAERKLPGDGLDSKDVETTSPFSCARSHSGFFEFDVSCTAVAANGTGCRNDSVAEAALARPNRRDAVSIVYSRIRCQ